MANKDRLSKSRAGTVINAVSKKQEQALIRAVLRVEAHVRGKFGVRLSWEKKWLLADVVKHLQKKFPDVDFNNPLKTSSMNPDGGILSVVDIHGGTFPILIAEKKNQGTNDRILAAGKKKQAKGNAIERLGKNVIGLKTAMLGSGIFPFVCFGDGCDFADSSSILDRVVTIAMFGHLRTIYLTPQGGKAEFLRGSFYFREEHWTEDEMYNILVEVAVRAMYHYLSSIGESAFRNT